METLPVSFLSGSVLELAATLGVALVAVTTGVRLVSGGRGPQAGLTVIVLAPELYQPFRRLGAEYAALVKLARRDASPPAPAMPWGWS